MKTLWRIINILTLLSIVLVVIYSEYVTSTINTYRDLLNATSHEELNDAEHVLRLFLNKWEGIALGFTLSFIFLTKYLIKKATGVLNKISN